MKKRYTVGIVEDEQIEQKALSLMISRNRQNLEVAFAASDGKTALHLTRQYAPDILIVDIKIPEISGLELCSILREEGYEGYLIISTSYPLFHYAYQAIKLQAVDYLLKPTQEKQILGVLDRCTSLLDEEKGFEEREKKWKEHMSQAKHEADAWIIERVLNADSNLLPRMQEIGFPQDGQWQSFWLSFSYEDSGKMDADVCSALEKEFFAFAGCSKGRILLFLQPKTSYDVFQLYALLRCKVEGLRQCLSEKQPVFCYVSQMCRSIQESRSAGERIPEDLPDFKTTCSCTANLFFDQPARAFAREQYVFTMHRMLRLLQDKKRRQLEHTLLAEIRQYAEKDRGKAWELLRIFMDALTIFEGCPDFSAWEKNIADSHLITDLSALSDMIRQSLFLCESQLPDDTQNSMDKILHIMRTEYASSLSQADVARRMGMTQPYFSRMFKNKIGKNFVSVLTDIRMEHAKQLIAEKEAISAEELALLCGYTSKAYFCALFRKTTGMTVSEYQRRRKYEA